MAPNLYYGQIQPRDTPPNKGHGGFIEWTHLPSMLDKVTLLRQAFPTVWTNADHAQLQAWLAELLVYVESKTAAGERDMSNNHGTYATCNHPETPHHVRILRYHTTPCTTISGKEYCCIVTVCQRRRCACFGTRRLFILTTLFIILN